MSNIALAKDHLVTRVSRHHLSSVLDIFCRRSQARSWLLQKVTSKPAQKTDYNTNCLLLLALGIEWRRWCSFRRNKILQLHAMNCWWAGWEVNRTDEATFVTWKKVKMKNYQSKSSSYVFMPIHLFEYDTVVYPAKGSYFKLYFSIFQIYKNIYLSFVQLQTKFLKSQL